MDRLEAYLEKEDPNIVCLTEHHLNEQERRNVNFENFYEGGIFFAEAGRVEVEWQSIM